MDETRQFGDGFADKYAAGIFWLGILLLVGSLIMLAVQIISFLKNDTWPDWVLLDVIYPISPAQFLRWLTSPQDWLGLHKIVMTILLETPTFVGMIILGLICTYGPIKVGKVYRGGCNPSTATH